MNDECVACERADDNAIVHRAAPGWAWDIIDNLLSLPAFVNSTPAVQQSIRAAHQAMIDASEEEYPT